MSRKSIIISVLLMGGTLVLVGAISTRGVPAVSATNLENIPMRIGDYLGTDDSFDQSVYDELNADRHVYRHYRAPDGRQVDLYIGYYGTAKGGRTPHNPYACLPGAGWGILQTREVELMPSYQPDPVEANYILASKGDLYESVIHWYQSAGTQVLASGLAQNFHRFVGRIFYNRNDGAFVRISTVSTSGGRKTADERVQAFAQQIIDLLPGYWPEER